MHQCAKTILSQDQSHAVQEISSFHSHSFDYKNKVWRAGFPGFVCFFRHKGLVESFASPKSLLAKRLEQASQWYEMYCQDLKVMSSNPGWVKLGVRSIGFLFIVTIHSYIVTHIILQQLNILETMLNIFALVYASLPGESSITVLQAKLVIRLFMECLKISIILRNDCFNQAFHEMAKFVGISWNDWNWGLIVTQIA